MAINLGGNISGQQSLNLQKNQVLDLKKAVPALEEVIVGAGWDVAETGAEFDLDIAAFLLNSNGKIQRVPDDVIFFNNMQAQGIRLTDDNRTGEGDGDDERIIINLNQLPQHVEKIVFTVTIFEGALRRQTFGMINNSFIRLLDAKNNEKELCIFNLKEESSVSTSVIFSELYKENGSWKFKAIGETKVGDLNSLLSLYV